MAKRAKSATRRPTTTTTPPALLATRPAKGRTTRPSEINRDEDNDLIQIITTGVDPVGQSEEPARIVDRKEY